jgi:hypothetical protein
MRNVTYKELFDESLEENISAGGDVGSIVTLVNAYQNHDATARHFVFNDWLDRESLTCSLCAKFFKVATNEVEENQYVLCPKCRRQNF